MDYNPSPINRGHLHDNKGYSAIIYKPWIGKKSKTEILISDFFIPDYGVLQCVNSQTVDNQFNELFKDGNKMKRNSVLTKSYWKMGKCCYNKNYRSILSRKFEEKKIANESNAGGLTP